MTGLSDELERLERDLFKYPGTDEDAFLGRRLVLREAFQSWGDARYGDGLADGRRDVYEARRLAEKAGRAAEQDASDA